MIRSKETCTITISLERLVRTGKALKICRHSFSHSLSFLFFTPSIPLPTSSLSLSFYTYIIWKVWWVGIWHRYGSGLLLTRWNIMTVEGAWVVFHYWHRRLWASGDVKHNNTFSWFNSLAMVTFVLTRSSFFSPVPPTRTAIVRLNYERNTPLLVNSVFCFLFRHYKLASILCYSKLLSRSFKGPLVRPLPKPFSLMSPQLKLWRCFLFFLKM